MTATDPWLLYIASSAGEPGVWSTRLDPRTGSLDTPEPLGGPPAASFVRSGPGRMIYAVCDAESDAEGLTGRLHALRVRPDGRLQPQATRRTEGTTPCFISVSPDERRVYVASFRGAGGRPSAGSAASYALDESGLPRPPVTILHHEGSSVHPERQTHPHFHCIVPDPSNRFVLVADLGSDAVVLYLREEMAERPLREVARAAARPGSGPRHAAFSPDGRLAFVIHEMSNTVACYRVEPRGGLERVSEVSALPADFQDGSAAADLHVHPSGRHVYGSHRGHDSIAVLRVDEQGSLELQRCVPAGGGNPRGFALTPDGSFLVCASAAEDRLTAFRVDPETGDWEPAGSTEGVPSPVCVHIPAP
jgi:6-phosphogluconolactonase